MYSRKTLRIFDLKIMAVTQPSQKEDVIRKHIKYIRNFPFPIGPSITEETIMSALDYSPLDDDIIISTYPKTGTTWVQYIVLQLLRGPECLPSVNELTFTVAPYLERTGSSVAETLPSPRFVKFHLPYHLTPHNKKAKYIYTVRNPKDTLVSYYNYHLALAPPLDFVTLDTFFECFMKGEIAYGCFFEHLLSWYPHKDDENVLFVNYEELLSDVRGQILRIAAFLGEEYADALRRNDELLSEIIENTSFSNMKKNVFLTIPDPDDASLETGGKVKEKTVTFFRKGIQGDWKNYLSDQQRRILDDKAIEKLGETDFIELWGIQKNSE